MPTFSLFFDFLAQLPLIPSTAISILLFSSLAPSVWLFDLNYSITVFTFCSHLFSSWQIAVMIGSSFKYVFAAGGDGIHLCVDEKGTFRESNFVKCLGHLSDTVNPNLKEARGRRGGNKDLKGKSDLYKIIKMIWIRNYQPVIVFSFSKRECEGNALQMSKLDFNDETEKEMISAVYKNAMASLSEEDQQLPQILHLLPLLQRGIGIHHSGLLPILKEVIEILFQEALIKVLFATETFSIGLNMPAKTVVFTDISKWDGTATRWLTSGEYIQMSGRAGRRGSKFTIVICFRFV